MQKNPASERLHPSIKEDSKILFIALNGIGNLITATPAFTNLKINLPNAKIHVLALKDSQSLLKGSPYVDKFIEYPAGKSLLPRIAFLLGLRKENYDISFYPYPNVNFMSSAIAFLTGAAIRVNFKYPLFGKDRNLLDTCSVVADPEKHDVEKNLDLLRIIGIKTSSKKMFIPVSEEDKKHVDHLLKGVGKHDTLIGMHIGSKERRRIWPAGDFAALAQKIVARKNMKVVLVGGAIEEKLLKETEGFDHPRIINLIRKTSIPQTAYLMQQCKLFIANNSGPMHMAAASGTEVITIYLTSDIKRLYPFGVDYTAFLLKRDKPAIDNHKNHIYADQITPDMVFESVELSLKRSKQQDRHTTEF